MNWFETGIRVRYRDTDQMGVVHHSVFACYCEIGRTELCEDIGLPYHELERTGIFLMVAEMRSRFKRPIRYGDRVIIRTRIAKLTRRTLEFHYEIRNESTDRTAFVGSTKHLFTRGTQKTMSLPDTYFNLLRRAVAPGSPPN